MSRSFRSLLTAALVVLHAAFAVGGAGLHALPGWGHGTGLTQPAKNDHSHGPGKSSHEAADDCAVCQFFAQGQLSTTGPTGRPVRLVALAETPATPSPTPAPARSPSIPRAPPTA